MLAATVDPAFTGVVASAQKLADTEAVMAESMAWARDFFIEAAQHPEAYQQFREAIRAGKTADTAERAALRDTRRTMPVGGSTVVVLDQVRGAR